MFREIKMCLRLNFVSILFSLLPQACDKVADVDAFAHYGARQRQENTSV
jgi:hypothetical protein